MTWLMLLASWWFSSTVPPPSIRAARHSANLAVTCMAHWIARVGTARRCLDINAVWILVRGRASAWRHERSRPWPPPWPRLPAFFGVGTILLKVSSGECARCQHLERTTRGRCLKASGARRAALRFNSALTALRGTSLLISCRRVVSVLCVACGSYGVCVVRRSLPCECPGAPTPGR